MPIKSDREYRAMAVMTRAAEADENYTVEGYATTFNDPYVVWEDEGIEYREEVDAHAFDDANMRDVIFQYDHEGMVFARVSNGTLFLTPDEHGLRIRADLSKTAAAREMYEAIAAGLVTEMSFAFTVAADEYDRDTHTRKITRIKKVYDVSAVSIPANPSTEISARSYFEGVIEVEKAERLRAEEQERQRQKIRILLNL